MRFNTFAAVILLQALTAAVEAGAISAEPVAIKTDPRQITVNNGLVEITLSRDDGKILNFRDIVGGQPRDIGLPGNAMYWDANGNATQIPPGFTPVKKGYYRLPPANDLVKVVDATDDHVDLAVKGGPTPLFPFVVEYHYVVFRGLSGFYAYVEISRTPDLPAANLAQTRFVMRTVVPKVFDTWAVGDGKFVPIPTADVASKVTDATFRLADGTIKTKYLNSVYWGETPVYGSVGHGTGLWMLTASNEYHNGGPVKQGQTLHDDVVLRVLQSGHFGASGLDFADNEAWRKVYGPFLVYVNHGGDEKALFADAQRQRADEVAKWPYGWVKSPDYKKERGTVVGRLNLAGGSAKDAWVILAAPGGDWTAQGKGYMYWTRADAEGKFAIPKVIPGSYTLYASGADQPVDFSHDGVSVAVDQTTELGTLDWPPVNHGERLWQIGTFDRSAHEFRNGDDARHYQMFALYPQQFPNDVDFTIGKNDIAKDWNYAQWTFYSKTPVWRLHFDLPMARTGTAALTIGFASAQPPPHKKLTDLRVTVNGKEIAAIRLPKTGTAGYRGGSQDSPWNVKTVEFDASLLKAGANEITLGHFGAVPFAQQPTTVPAADNEDAPPSEGTPGQVMYDALRLEVK